MKATIIDLHYTAKDNATKCIIRFRNPYTNCINKVTGVTKKNPNDEHNTKLAFRIAEGRAKMQMFQRLRKSATDTINNLYESRVNLRNNERREKAHINELLNTKNND